MSMFRVGQIVCLKADSSRQGSIIEVLYSPGGPPKYRVFHGAVDIQEYFEDQLLLIQQPGSGLEPALWLGLEEFRARLTAARLSHSLTDNLYALHSARIQYLPFQFKPLLRLIRGDRPRLLIADEVGVGKTIEAGLILRELQSRQDLENVLIVCPKPLVSKWRAEMRRFDEDFYVLSPESIRYCLRETDYNGAWPAKYSRAIVNLELLRNPDYLFGLQGRYSRPGLATLNAPTKFDLIIFDEAHHLRNPETNSHQLPGHSVMLLKQFSSFRLRPFSWDHGTSSYC